MKCSSFKLAFLYLYLSYSCVKLVIVCEMCLYQAIISALVSLFAMFLCQVVRVPKMSLYQAIIPTPASFLPCTCFGFILISAECCCEISNLCVFATFVVEFLSVHLCYMIPVYLVDQSFLTTYMIVHMHSLIRIYTVRKCLLVGFPATVHI